MIKVSELSGADLDYYAGRASGIPAEHLHIETKPGTGERICILKDVSIYSPSTNWSLGGPILGRMIGKGFGISKNPQAQHGVGEYVCGAIYGTSGTIEFGDTPLIAVCRASVLEAFGPEVAKV